MSVATAFATNLLREITPRVHIAARPSHRRRWVAKSTDHDYADAQRRGNGVTLFLGEHRRHVLRPHRVPPRSGQAVPPAHHAGLHVLRRVVLIAAQSFYAHHAAAISAAIVSADADTVANKASSLSVLLSAGIGV